MRLLKGRKDFDKNGVSYSTLSIGFEGVKTVQFTLELKSNSLIQSIKLLFNFGAPKTVEMTALYDEEEIPVIFERTRVKDVFRYVGEIERVGKKSPIEDANFDQDPESFLVLCAGFDSNLSEKFTSRVVVKELTS